MIKVYIHTLESTARTCTVKNVSALNALLKTMVDYGLTFEEDGHRVFIPLHRITKATWNTNDTGNK